MVKKSKSFALLLVVNILFFSFFFFYNCWSYQYLKINLNRVALIFLLAVIVIFDLINIIVYLLLRRTHILIKFVSMLLVFAFTMWVALVAAGLFCAGVFWESETSDFSTFDTADEDILIAGVSIDEIVTLEVESVEDFYYFYKYRISGDLLEFKIQFSLSNESYALLKQKFIDAPEFELRTLALDYDVEFDATGEFIWLEDVPSYESETSATRLQKAVVLFSDVDKSFYLHFLGEIG